MKKIITAIILASSAIPAIAENQFSAELLIGKADQDSSVTDFESTSGDDTSFGIRGSYLINENFGLEVAFQDYGETDDVYIDDFGDTINDMVSTTALTFGAKGIIPLENGFSLNGRLGLSLWDIDFKETDSAFPGEIFKADDDGNDFYYGIGIQYAIDQKFSVGAEYTVTDMDASLATPSGSIPVDHDVKNIAIYLSINL